MKDLGMEIHDMIMQSSGTNDEILDILLKVNERISNIEYQNDIDIKEIQENMENHVNNYHEESRFR